MSQRRDSSIQPDGALTLSDQETQEHAHGRGAIFRCSAPPGTTFFENKLSQATAIKTAWLISDSTEQLANVDAIGGEGHVRDTALLVHPLTESRQQSRIVIGRAGQVDDSGISEVAQEQVGTTNQFLRPCMAVLLTLAPTQVPREPYQRLFVQLPLWRAVLVVPIYEMDEVLRRSEMFAGRNAGVAGVRSTLSKTFQQEPTRTIPKYLNPSA
jgi:hypothetical protein